MDAFNVGRTVSIDTPRRQRLSSGLLGDLQRRLAERLRFETLVSELCAGFIGIRANEVDRQINDGLRRIAEELDVDRAGLGELRDDGVQIHVTHSWTRHVIPALPRRLESAAFPWITARLRRGFSVCFSRPEELPDEATTDRRNLRALGTRSMALVPFVTGGTVGGALGVTMLRRRRTWPRELVERLRVLGDVFAMALLRSRAEQALVESTARRLQAEEDAEREREALAHALRVTTLGELAGSLVHEVNQPLTAILSNAQAATRLLGREATDDDEVLVALKDIAQEARRASRVVGRLRALFKKEHADRRPVDVGEVIAEVHDLLRKDFERRGVTAELHLPLELPRVHADVVQLQQVVLNLLINAAEAVAGLDDRRRTIHVDASLRAPEMLEIAVRDAGVGVKEAEDLDRIFERFVTTKPDGLGMGLSISRSIVQTHGGRIWATRNPDRGLTVHVELPCQGT